MRLREINLQFVLEKYQSYDFFLNELDKLSAVLSGNQKHRIDNIIIYFNNLFELEIDLHKDVLLMKHLVIDNLREFKKILLVYNSTVVIFLIDLMTYNLDYVSNIQRLTGT